MRSRTRIVLGAGLCLFLPQVVCRAADEPKQTPKNTLTLSIPTTVKPQTFAHPVKFFLRDVIDRSGDPQPMLVFRRRGGAFLDRQPREIVRQALTETLNAAGLLADDEASASHILTVYVFHFGLAEGSGAEFYSKVDLNAVVKDARSGQSAEVPALGTSIERTAIRKKNIMGRVKANLEEAVTAALTNLLRGKKLREALESLEAATASQP